MSFELWRPTKYPYIVGSVPSHVRPLIDDALRDIQTRGCVAFDYRLAADTPQWSGICVRHVRTWRIVAAFWDPTTIALLRIQEHKSNSDLYGTFADDLGIPKVTGPRNAPRRDRPSCCDNEGLSPLSEQIRSVLDEFF